MEIVANLAENAMDGQLTYSFISLATARNTPDGTTVPVEGMKLLAALAHRYGIPVTWVVDSNSVQESKAVLTQGHRECGDDVILQIDVSSVFEESGSVPESKAEEIVILRQRLPHNLPAGEGQGDAAVDGR